jgi:hypothetical protein
MEDITEVVEHQQKGSYLSAVEKCHIYSEHFRMGTRGNVKKGKTQREMDKWSKTEHDKQWTDRRETETDGKT